MPCVAGWRSRRLDGRCSPQRWARRACRPRLRPAEARWRRYIFTQENLARGDLPAPASIAGASLRPADVEHIGVVQMGKGLRLSLLSVSDAEWLFMRHGGGARQLAPHEDAPWLKTRWPVATMLGEDRQQMAFRTDGGRCFLVASVRICGRRRASTIGCGGGRRRATALPRGSWRRRCSRPKPRLPRFECSLAPGRR